jgi:hypothetical protein
MPTLARWWLNGFTQREKRKNKKVKRKGLQSIDLPYDIKRRCYLFSKELLLFISTQRYQRIYHSIFDQLLRSGTSIGANVVEGGVGSSKKDVINFYHIALKSANETKYWLFN